MSETPFSNREIESMHNNLMEKMDMIHQEGKKERGKIWEQVKFTNGKLRKVVVALLILAGFVMGMFGKDVLPLIMAAI